MRSVHIHIVLEEDPHWDAYHRFRELLRTDPAAFDEYATMKARLAEEFSTDRPGYTDAKARFVTEMLERDAG